MDRRSTRSPARFVAPLALVAVLFAILMIVGSSGGGDDTSTSTNARDETTETQRTGSDDSDSDRTQTERSEADSGPRFYRVQVGDTLGGIADKTGVPLERIEELNPDIDPQAMTAGQRIKLR